MTTLAVYVCTCPTPQPYTKPSGTVICQQCALPIVTPRVDGPRP